VTLSTTQTDTLGERLRRHRAAVEAGESMPGVPEALRRHNADRTIEVGLLEADSRETLPDTHARYVKTVAEIARPF
jgi:hypothetical protein